MDAGSAPDAITAPGEPEGLGGVGGGGRDGHEPTHPGADAFLDHGLEAAGELRKGEVAVRVVHGPRGRTVGVTDVATLCGE